MENLTFREIRYGSDDYQNTIKLRDKILRKPLGLQFTEAQLAQEVNDFHIGAFINEELVACLILSPVMNENKIKMRQVAVDEQWQSKGIGRKLIEFAEKFSQNKGFLKIYCHARMSAVTFYLNQQYTIAGDEFTEVSIPHFPMEKNL